MIGTIHYGVHKSKLFAYHNYIFTCDIGVIKRRPSTNYTIQGDQFKDHLLVCYISATIKFTGGHCFVRLFTISFLYALISVSCSHKKSPWSEFRLSYILFFVTKSLTNHFYFYCLSIRFTGIYILFLQPLLIIYN